MLTRPFDALLSEIMVKPAWVTPSVLQTIAQAVDCLNLLLNSNSSDLSQPVPQAKVLAVDDDAVCNHVMVSTLKRANFDAKSIDDPFAALELIEKTQYDLILLDINMPGLTGFELCEKLRLFPHCKDVPVIFITGHNNFDNRKQCVLSGGHDFITKPVSSSELALKATLHLLKSRTKSAGSPVPTPAPAAVEQSGGSQENESSPVPIPATAGNGADSASDEPVQAIGCAGNEIVPGENQVIEFARNENTRSAPADEAHPAHNPEELSQELVVTGISPQESHGEDVVECAGARLSTTETGTAIPDGPMLENSPDADSASNGQVDVPASFATSHPEPGDLEAKMDGIVRIVAKVMFGENGATVANLRLVRIALDHYKLGDILKRGEQPVVCSQSDSE
jgi:CheY-like chemotaxis protein